MDVYISRFEELVQLWQVSFGDSKPDIEQFLNEHRNRFVLETNTKNEKLVSAMYLLPAVLQVNGKAFDCHYAYAVATFPKERGRGYCSEMLENVSKKYPDMKIFLVPEDEGLIRFYGKCGYSLLHSNKNDRYNDLFSRDVCLFNQSDDFEKYYKDRKDLLKKENCITWGTDQMRYIYENSSTPKYQPLMVNSVMREFLTDKGIEDLYFNFAME